jgi:hypothetical protein
VTRLLAEMPAAEIRAWAIYRARFGLVHRHSHLLLARLAHGFFSVNRGKDSEAPDFADFYPAMRKPEQNDTRYTPEELKSLRSLMSDR